MGYNREKMGLRHILGEKKKDKQPEEVVLPEGKEVVVESEEDFLATCRNLEKEFMGVMCLTCDVDGEKYNTSLVLDKGKVVASTLEYAGKIEYSNVAVGEIENKLRGKKGGMSLYELETEDDLNLMLESNPEARLDDSIPLSSLGMKINFNLEGSERSKKTGGFQPIKLDDLFSKNKFNLLELARTPLDQQISKHIDMNALLDKLNAGKLDMDQVRNMLRDAGEENVNERLMELRKRKRERDLKITQKLSKTRKEQKSKKESTGKEKINTPIDKLYEMVQEKGKVSINNGLAKKLGVKRAQIEGWALILEDHNLVELHYPTIGEPEIRRIQGS